MMENHMEHEREMTTSFNAGTETACLQQTSSFPPDRGFYGAISFGLPGGLAKKT